jgi:hypothetical protein
MRRLTPLVLLLVACRPVVDDESMDGVADTGVLELLGQ